MKLVIAIAMTTAVLLMEVHICAAVCKPNYWADGCSHVADFNFKPDCDKHDICYVCGSKYGLSRLDCDDRWYNNMINTCDNTVHWFWRPGCKMMAWIYYRAVRDWSASSWNRVVNFCNEKWVSGCVE